MLLVLIGKLLFNIRLKVFFNVGLVRVYRFYADCV